jgi:ABC-2 type transport system permease protein
VIALIRTEFFKAACRMRTLVIGGVLVGLPALIVFAIKAHGQRRSIDDDSIGLFRLAQLSGYLVPAAVLSVMSGFLLLVIAGMFAGDSVAGDSSWGNLRYLLMRPVPRGRLLVAKAIVAGILIWASTILVAGTALAGGILVFGGKALTVPGFGPFATGNLSTGFHLSQSALLLRLGIGTAYVAFGFTALLALGTFFSILTDNAASAIGATVGVYIVSEILDGISQLGRVRYFFPTHYMDVWSLMFTDNRYSRDMITGIVVQVVYFVVFGTAAIVWFKRKDIRS